MTAEGSKEARTAAMQRADEKLQLARLAFANRMYAGAISAAYYAAFYAASAALNALGVEARSHEGVQQMFSLHFVRPGLFPPSDARLLRSMQKERQEADYSLYAVFSEQEAKEAIEGAEHLFARAGDFLKTRP